jgi:dolichyl-phosphate beta-glucosyltransferase
MPKINTWAKQLPKALRLKVIVISYKNNRGKGYAIRQGMLASVADYTLFFDADMSTPLSEIKKFAPHMKQNIDIIIGTRKNGKSTVIKAQPLYRRMLGKTFTTLANFIMQTTVTDFTCGFKAFSKQAKDTIFPLTNIDRWTYDAEIIFIGQKYGFPTKEVAVAWSNDDRSKVRIIKDITTTLYELFIIRMHSLNGRYTDQPALSPLTR